MVKRKAPSSDLPETISLQPVIEPSTSGRPGPFALYFASGFEPSSDDACAWEVHTSTVRRHQHLVIARTGNVDFVGASQPPDAAGPPACRYAVGVLDKRQGVMRYAEVGAGAVVRMEPRARGINYGPSGAITGVEDNAQARLEQNKRLVAAFGSNRRRRQLDAKETGKVGGDNVAAGKEVEALLLKAADAATAAHATKAEVLAAVTGARNIPPHHAEATTAELAYRLEELVPREAWDALEWESLQRAIDDSGYRDDVLRAKGTFPDLVLDRLPLIKLQSPGAERRLRAFAYLGALLHLHGGRHELRVNAGSGGVRSLATRMKIQEEVLHGCLGRFYSRSAGEEDGAEVWQRTKEQARMLLLHLLLAALIAEEYELSAKQFEALRAALKASPQELVTCYKEMGCTTERAGAADAAGSPLKQYRVRLLPAAAGAGPPKKLGDMFPALAVGRRPQR